MQNRRNTLTHDPVITMPAATTSGLKTPADLVAQSEAFDQRKADYNEGLDKPYKFTFDSDMKLIPVNKRGGFNVVPVRWTQFSFAQLLGLLGRTAFGAGSGRGLPMEYLWSLAQQPDYQAALAQVMNVHIGKRTGDLLVRTYDVSAPGKADLYAIRAVLTDFYAPVSNTSMLQAFADAYALQAEQAGGVPQNSLIRPWVGPDDFNVKAVMYDVQPKDWNITHPEHQGDAPFGLGFMMSNSEIGNGSVKVLPVVQTRQCTNSIIIDAGSNSLNVVHRGDPRAILDRTRSVIGTALALSGRYLERLISMEDYQLPDFHTVITNMAKSKGWDVSVSDAVRQGSHGRENVAGLINGITYAAHSKFELQATVDLERYAGSILETPDKALKSFRA